MGCLLEKYSKRFDDFLLALRLVISLPFGLLVLKPICLQHVVKSTGGFLVMVTFGVYSHSVSAKDNSLIIYRSFRLLFHPFEYKKDKSMLCHVYEFPTCFICNGII